MRRSFASLACGWALAQGALACHSFDGFGPNGEEAGTAPVLDASVDGGADARVEAGAEASADASQDGAQPVSTADWSCLDAGPATPSLPAVVDVTIDVVDTFQPIVTAGATGGSDLAVVSATPLPGVSVRACSLLDPTCATSPVTGAVSSDDAGVAHLMLPSTFDGVLRLSRSDLFTGTAYVGRFVDVAPGYPMPMINAVTAEAFAAEYGVTLSTSPDAGLGQLFVSVYDCNDRFAPGVSLQYEPTGAVTFYGDPTTLVSTTDTATTTKGGGGAFDVPAGEVTVTATIVADGRVFRSTKVSVASGGATLLLLRARTVP